jgi:high-affinity Fe2+/Pb2+ permease
MPPKVKGHGLRKVKAPAFLPPRAVQEGAMQTIASAALSLGVIAAFALIGGGLYLLIRQRNLKQGLLMLMAAAVLIGNVLVWTVPA